MLPAPVQMRLTHSLRVQLTKAKQKKLGQGRSGPHIYHHSRGEEQGEAMMFDSLFRRQSKMFSLSILCLFVQPWVNCTMVITA